MNRKWIVPLVAAAVAGLVAYGITRSRACPGSHVDINRLQDVTFLVRELQLSDAQAQEIRQLNAALGSTLNDCCARHCSARSRLGAAVAEGTNGLEQTESILRDMCRAYEQSERATIEHWQAIRALLGEAQKARFDALISRCVCGPCDRHGCGAPAGGENKENKGKGEQQ